MALNFMYITNDPLVAQIAQDSGVDRIFVDLEYIGKTARQAGKDTVISKHTLEDVKAIRKVVSSSKLLVRVNPIHEKAEEDMGSQDEINAVIEAGADIVMLPYFKTAKEVETFLSFVNGRAKTMLLLETKEAVDVLDEILMLPGIGEIHIGLNDLSLSLHKTFLFETLADGYVENICRKIKEHKIPFGFGGIARLDYGNVPAQLIVKEHYRLGSTRAILSRAFCNAKNESYDSIRTIFEKELKKIKELEQECASYDTNSAYFLENKEELRKAIQGVLQKMGGSL
ncbi:MAG: aldolase/citrate lyase family protein [Bacillota bacterium]|nr:aldolase/citrate lyase family protein [Bacillota bacterium]